MSNNYPPGADGNEPAISGDQKRLEPCPGCGRDGYGTRIIVSGHGGESYLVCNDCGYSFADDDDPEPDEQYEKKAGYY